MKKNLLFSMAVAVVVCFSVVTATLLTGCGSSASVKTVNIYNDTPKYEINTLTDHTTAMQGFELAGYGNALSSSQNTYANQLVFDRYSNSVNYLKVSKYGNTVVTKVVDGVTKMGVYSLRYGRMVFDLTECTDLEVVAETKDSTYVKYALTVNSKDYVRVEQCGVGVVFERECGLSEFNVQLIGSVVDGKTTYEQWFIDDKDVEYVELHKIKGDKRSVVYETRVDAGDPAWQSGLTPFSTQYGKLTLDNMYLFAAEGVDSAGGTTMSIYNMKKVKKVCELFIPMSGVTGLAMAGGVFYYQSMKKLPANSTNYDIFDDSGNVYSLETKVVNMETGSVSELKNFDYVLVDLVESENDQFALAEAIKIEDDKFFDSSAKPVYLQIDGNKKFKEIEYYKSATKLGEERFVLTYEGRPEFLKVVDANYDEVFVIDGVKEYWLESVGEMMAVRNGGGKVGIINKDGECVADFKYDDVVCVANGRMVVSEEKTVDSKSIIYYYSIDNTGVASEIASENVTDNKYFVKGVEVDNISFEYNLFYTKKVVDGKNVYAFYNALGEQVGSLTDESGSTLTVSVANYGINNAHIACMLIAGKGTSSAHIEKFATWYNESVVK